MRHLPKSHPGIVTFFCMFGLLPVWTASAYTSGSGTEVDPFIIDDTDDTMDLGWYATGGDVDMRASATVYVGQVSSDNHLTILAGHTLSCIEAYVGYEEGSGGSVTVTGTDSEWSLDSAVYVGYSGNGSLLVEDGGSVHSVGDAYVGCGGEGVVSISGASATFDSNTWVGNDGRGVFRVENGGSASFAGLTSIGSGTGGNNGYFLAVGASSSATFANVMVGESTEMSTFGGELSVNAGADATVSGYLRVGKGGGIGSVIVTGVGSTLTVSGDGLYLGYQGSGSTMSIYEGAVVYAESVGIGSISSISSSNVLSVAGEGSQLIVSNYLSLGGSFVSGNALEIDSGALVKVGDSLGGGLNLFEDNYIHMGSGYLALCGEHDESDFSTNLLPYLQVYNSDLMEWDAALSDDFVLTYVDSTNLASVTSATGYNGLEGYTLVTLTTTAVPEPATFALLGGVCAFGIALVRRRKA